MSSEMENERRSSQDSRHSMELECTMPEIQPLKQRQPHRSLQKEPLSIQLLALAEQPREQPPLEQEDFGVCPALAYV